MKVYEKIVIDMTTDEVIEEVSYDYEGSVALADFGGGGSAFSEAADAQTKAAQQAQQIQLMMYEQSRKDLAPYRGAGEQALPYYAGILNVPGYDKVDPTQALRAIPGYQWMFDQGQQAMVNKGLASGQYGSGAFEKGLQQYGMGLADTMAYTPYMNRLQGLTGMGENAAAQTGTWANQTGANLAGLQMGAGQAQSQGIMGQYAAGQQGMSQFLGGLGMLGGLGLGILGMPWGGGGAALGASLFGNA